MPPPTSTIATPELLLVRRQAGLGRGDLRQHRVDHLEPGAVHAGHRVLRGGGRAGDDVDVHLEARARHAGRVADAVLVVDHELLRQHVQDLAVHRDRDRLGGVDHAAHVLLVDHPVLVGHRDHAARVEALDVGAGDADVGRADLDAGHQLRLLEHALDRVDGGLEVDHDTLAQAARLRLADADHVEAALVRDLGDDRADLVGADVQADDVAILLLGQDSLPILFLPACDRHGVPLVRQPAARHRGLGRVRAPRARLRGRRERRPGRHRRLRRQRGGRRLRHGGRRGRVRRQAGPLRVDAAPGSAGRSARRPGARSARSLRRLRNVDEPLAVRRVAEQQHLARPAQHHAQVAAREHVHLGHLAAELGEVGEQRARAPGPLAPRLLLDAEQAAHDRQVEGRRCAGRRCRSGRPRRPSGRGGRARPARAARARGSPRAACRAASRVTRRVRHPGRRAQPRLQRVDVERRGCSRPPPARSARAPRPRRGSGCRARRARPTRSRSLANTRCQPVQAADHRQQPDGDDLQPEHEPRPTARAAAAARACGAWAAGTATPASGGSSGRSTSSSGGGGGPTGRPRRVMRGPSTPSPRARGRCPSRGARVVHELEQAEHVRAAGAARR